VNLDVRELKIGKLRTGAYQPREEVDQGSEEFQQLVASIKEKGVLTPLLVIESEEQGMYDVLAGERRLKAAQAAGLKKLPARLLAELADSDKVEVALTENLLRSDLTAWEIACAFKILIEDKGVSQEDLAKHLGMSPQKLSRQMSILRAPDWLQKFSRSHKMGYSVTDLLVRLLNSYPEKKVRAMARGYADKKLGKRDLEKALSAARKKAGAKDEGDDEPAKAKRDPARRFADLVQYDEKAGRVKVKAVSLSRKAPPTTEQLKELMDQFEKLKAIVEELFAEVPEGKQG